MSSVLYDVPGPRARRRNRIAGLLASAVLLALVGLAVARLQAEDQLSADKWEVFVTPFYIGALWEGLQTTLSIAAVAIATSIGYGALLASMRLSALRPVRWVSTVLVEFFRALPLLVLLFGLFLAYGSTIGANACLVIGLTLYNGSVLAEVFRAGVLALPRGQSEAAYAIGLNRGQTLRTVLVPQAARIMLPAIISQCVVVLKDTALGYAITVQEFVQVGEQIEQEFRNAFATAVVLAAVYIVINHTLSMLAHALERRLARRGTRVPRQTEGDLMGGGPVGGSGVAG